MAELLSFSQSDQSLSFVASLDEECVVPNKNNNDNNNGL